MVQQVQKQLQIDSQRICSVTLTAAMCSHNECIGVMTSYGRCAEDVSVEAISQMFKILSLPPLASNLPLGAHSKPQTSCEW